MATEGEDSCGVCTACRDRRVGPVELLDKYWFFHNTLDGFRVPDSTIEDSCTKNSLEMEVKDSNEPTAVSDAGFGRSVAPVNDESIFAVSATTTTGENRSDGSNLVRAPSLRPYIGKIEAGRGEDGGRKPRETKLQRNIDGALSAPLIGAIQGKESQFVDHKLLRAPSLPPDIGRKNAVQGGGESFREARQTRRQQKEGSVSSSATPSGKKNQSSGTNLNLVRAPSLPPAKAKKEEEAQEKESRGKPRISSLHRSMSSSLDIRSSYMPPGYKSYSSKSSKQLNIPRDRQPSKPNRQKSLSELEFEELQGFMDLGFTFNRDDINPSILNMIPGLQENRPIDEEKVSRPYLSEAWSVQRPNPPSLNWDNLDSSSVDMKEQLKVWARTVASNISQKC